MKDWMDYPNTRTIERMMKKADKTKAKKRKRTVVTPEMLGVPSADQCWWLDRLRSWVERVAPQIHGTQDAVFLTQFEAMAEESIRRRK